jgi:PD-(D/E)XK nuclease superfamily
MVELTAAELVGGDDPPIEIPSKFLPGTNIQYAWDATSLESFKRCPRLYQYEMIEGWRPKNESVHLRWGAEFHTAMHQYQLVRADGIAHDEAVFHVVRELMYRVEDWESDNKYKNVFTLIRSVIRYLDQYEHDPAKTVMQANGKPAVELSFSFELDYGPTNDQPYILCGHLDRVVDFQGEIFTEDYKSSTSTPGSYFWNQFEPNNQMSLYTLAGKIVFQTNIKGVLIDSIQIMIDDTRCTRGTTYRTQDQLQEWLADLGYWLSRAVDYADAGYWPMNDTACDKYGGCKFREICSKSPGVRERFLKGDFNKEEPWNPLKPR